MSNSGTVTGDVRRCPIASTRATERGSVSVMAPVLIASVLAVLGLAFDGGTAITVHQRAIGIAEQAARAGAGQLDLASIRAGGPYRIQPGKARQAAQRYLATVGYPGQVRLGHDAVGDRVDVTITWSQHALFARVVGVSHYGGTVEASAHVCHGVAQEEGC